ncbi:MmgE/PrpD family protein [Halalkalibaculum sp. DA3122]|uniref:MmgE/PrpD family protein n=1 Tax=Halalkalibaculum sp. DA3122 TaxID=3373607 RepID=UPI0037549711
MTRIEELATFVTGKKFEDLSGEAVRELKIRLLDSLACAIGAQEGAPPRRIKAQLDDFGGNPLATLIGGGKTAPDRAAFYNSALVRYLDYNDSYLAKNETGHPSDNIGSVLAAAEYADRSGKDFLTALGVAYQVQCRLNDEAPVRDKGFDHTVQGSYSAAAGASAALGLNAAQAANALAIAGTAYNALRVSRTGTLSNWKGLAFPSAGWTSTHAAFLAMRGITGPEEVFEGNKGFEESIAGPFYIDWRNEDLERVNSTIIKKYNAEIHSQSTLEGVIELRERHDIDPDTIEKIELNTFDVAYHIIGGGEEGDKKNIRTKEEADHSLPYMISAALLDGNVLPAQYKPERIRRGDIQSLLQKVEVREKQEYSDRFPGEEACDITIHFKNGEAVSIEKHDYEGFHTRPASWDFISEKFHHLAGPFVEPELEEQVVDLVRNFEQYQVTDLTALLARVHPVAAS